MKKAREWWLAMPPKDYDGGPGAWQTKYIAERSYFPIFKRELGNRIKIAKPSEIVRVREVLPRRPVRKNRTGNPGRKK